MKKIILILFFFSSEIWAEKAQCDRYLAKIKEIQKIQNDFSSPDGSVASLQETYDKQMAQLVILKGIQELKDDYIRNRGSLREILPEKNFKIDELSDELEKDIASSSKLLSLEDLMDEMEADKKLREAENSDQFINQLKNDCKGKNSNLCEDLDSMEPMTRGMSVSMKLQNNSGSVGDYRNLLREDLAPRNDRKIELEITKKAQGDVSRLKKCLKTQKKSCDEELATLKNRVSQIEEAMKKDVNFEKNVERLAISDSYGDIETLVNTMAQQIKEKEEGSVPGRTEILNNLNKRIKKNFEVVNLRSQIRGKKYDPNKPPVITEKNAQVILKDLFAKIGCSSKDLNSCLEKLSVDSSKLDKEIARVESEVENTTKKLNKFTGNINYKKMEEIKAILISLTQEECRDEKVGNARAFTPCTIAQDNASPSTSVTKFALGVGRAIAEVDGNLFIHKDSTQLGRKNKLNQLCKENFTLVGSRFSSGDFCSNLYAPGGTAVDKIKRKITGEKPQAKTQCGPAPYCMDWMAFYEKYDIERDDSGKILSIKRLATNSELVAPALANSVLTLAPLGLQMYQSDQYLKVMQNQAAYQAQVNMYRKNYPNHTFMWDRGYRGFTDGYVGGPTLQNPGVTGYGALGNPYAGYGAWNPYGLSGVLPYQLGMYSYNPYYNGNFQFGSTYTFNQLTH
jgi:CRISPR/Cas system-associated protein endoribonuclease Cas2